MRMSRVTLAVVDTLTVLLVGGCAGELRTAGEDRAEQTLAGPTARIVAQGLTAELYEFGPDGKTVVVLEGFDPHDDVPPGAYFLQHMERGAPVEPLLGGLAYTAQQQRWSVWMVSANRDGTSSSSIATLSQRYLAGLHDAIRTWNGVARKYILVGVSMGGLWALRVANDLGAARSQQLAALFEFDAPLEGANIPTSIQMYMADQRVCGTKSLGNDIGCHERYVVYGLATPLARDLIKHRIRPVLNGPQGCPGDPVSIWPSTWTDCHDLGGCTLPNDMHWNKCGDYDGGFAHGNFVQEDRAPSYFKQVTGGLPGDIPTYAVSNSDAFVSPSARDTSGARVIKTAVNNAGDHLLYPDAFDDVQQRASSRDPFSPLLDGAEIPDWLNTAVIHAPGFSFVSRDSAFGATLGYHWTGRLLGQCFGNQPHGAVTGDTVSYASAVFNGVWGGHPPAGDNLPTCSNDAVGENDAAYRNQFVPVTMPAGQTATIRVQMTNTGSSTWSAAGGYKLGSQNPQDNLLWGLNRVNILGGYTVPPGGWQEFQFAIRAPAQPGYYAISWKMLREGVEWFGDTTAPLTVWVY